MSEPSPEVPDSPELLELLASDPAAYAFVKSLQQAASAKDNDVHPAVDLYPEQV